jgi:hypothetical protein
MSDIRKKILEEISEERQRQLTLAGVEFDMRNTPNDWAAIISSYALRNLSKKNIKPDANDFKEDMISAAAIILASIEHLEDMKNKNFFKE